MVQLLFEHCPTHPAPLDSGRSERQLQHFFIRLITTLKLEALMLHIECQLSIPTELDRANPNNLFSLVDVLASSFYDTECCVLQDMAVRVIGKRECLLQISVQLSNQTTMEHKCS